MRSPSIGLLALGLVGCAAELDDDSIAMVERVVVDVEDDSEEERIIVTMTGWQECDGGTMETFPIATTALASVGFTLSGDMRVNNNAEGIPEFLSEDYELKSVQVFTVPGEEGARLVDWYVGLGRNNGHVQIGENLVDTMIEALYDAINEQAKEDADEGEDPVPAHLCI